MAWHWSMMANFEAFRRVIKSSINLLFLKSEILLIYNKHNIIILDSAANDYSGSIFGFFIVKYVQLKI